MTAAGEGKGFPGHILPCCMDEDFAAPEIKTVQV